MSSMENNMLTKTVSSESGCADLVQKKRCTAVVLAAGKGSRMKTDVQKQFLLIKEKPILYYSLRCFEDSPLIDEIVLVTSEGMEEYCRESVIRKYGFRKVTAIVPGGKERYDSVYAGLKACHTPDYVFIHDSARPFITEEILQRNFEMVQKTGACITAVPSKDTIKIAGPEGSVKETPARETLWIVQTPQVFSYGLILQAYEDCRAQGMQGITDDAMVVEKAADTKVYFSMGSYQNIKITTPEDLVLAEAFMK